jgi:hypothetical protein
MNKKVSSIFNSHRHSRDYGDAFASLRRRMLSDLSDGLPILLAQRLVPLVLLVLLLVALVLLVLLLVALVLLVLLLVANSDWWRW